MEKDSVIYLKGHILGSDHPNVAELNLLDLCPTSFLVQVIHRHSPLACVIMKFFHKKEGWHRGMVPTSLRGEAGKAGEGGLQQV